jgi:hypothetical protein
MRSRREMVFPVPMPPVARKFAGVSEMGIGFIPHRKVGFSGRLGSPSGGED